MIPEVIRKAFKVAETEKPGACYVELPENVAEANVDGKTPLTVQAPTPPHPAGEKVEQAAQIISQARAPMIMAGNGVVRARASEQLLAFAEQLNIPVATTFMAKGCIPFSHPLSLGTVGLQAHDYGDCGFDQADVILCVGFDMIEYHPHLWHPTRDRKIVHIDESPAEVDEHYVLAVGVIGDIARSLPAIAAEAKPRESSPVTRLREVIVEELHACTLDETFPMKPQRIVHDLRHVLGAEDIAISDVGAHKMWMARLYEAEAPNTCIISNGFASMGIAVPGTIGARLAYPERQVVAVTGDAGFLMNAQEIETALRLGLALVVLIWRDDKYGLIEWHQNIKFGRPSHIDFGNPDLVKFAESFGARGYRVEAARDLVPTLQQALTCGTVAIIDCPVDYSENMKLTEKLGKLSVRI